jgi:hypothetical protein
VRGKSEKPWLHLWSENHNLTRRVLAITDHSEQRLALAVECAKPDRLGFLRIEFDRSTRELSREDFAQSIHRLCEHEFPDEGFALILQRKFSSASWNPRMQVVRVVLAASWRSGLSVVLRQ